MTKVESLELLDNRIKENKQTIKNSMMGYNAKGDPIASSTAQRLYWETNRENKIIMLVRELLEAAHDNITLSVEALDGLKVLATRRERLD
jgi:hypothetical protein